MNYIKGIKKGVTMAAFIYLTATAIILPIFGLIADTLARIDLF